MSDRSEGRRRRATIRVSRQGEAEREFDDRFWRDLGPEARLEALWEMVLEVDEWKGTSPGGQSRLQRSILRVERA
jgi:hypothetical protein